MPASPPGALLPAHVLLPSAVSPALEGTPRLGETDAGSALAPDAQHRGGSGGVCTGAGGLVGAAARRRRRSSSPVNN